MLGKEKVLVFIVTHCAVYINLDTRVKYIVLWLYGCKPQILIEQDRRKLEAIEI